MTQRWLRTWQAKHNENIAPCLHCVAIAHRHTLSAIIDARRAFHFPSTSRARRSFTATTVGHIGSRPSAWGPAPRHSYTSATPPRRPCASTYYLCSISLTARTGTTHTPYANLPRCFFVAGGADTRAQHHLDARPVKPLTDRHPSPSLPESDLSRVLLPASPPEPAAIPDIAPSPPSIIHHDSPDARNLVPTDVYPAQLAPPSCGRRARARPTRRRNG